MKKDGKGYQSKHFTLEQIGEGVYTAIARPEGWAISNAGIIDLGDRTLVFDTFMTPMAAHDLRLAAESLTGREVSLVINSHYHNDHIWGNQDFHPEADIISTAATRHLIGTGGMQEYTYYKDNSESRLKALRKQYNGIKDQERRQELAPQLTYYQALAETMPILEVRPPNLTFVEDLEFHGSQRSAVLIPTSGGHTASDAILYLPELKILFLSDLLFVQCHPYLGDGNPAEWSSILETIEQKYPAKMYVSGHGPLGAKKDLKLVREYIADLRSLAQESVSAGQPETALADVRIPRRYSSWEMPNFFYDNLRFLYKKLATI
jgi:glyoxylase-like metal-dependent hydrolase (beta-lactamase superfamily II)